MALSGTFKLTGHRAAVNKLVKLHREFPNRVERALREEGETIMFYSKRDYVPVDLGTLRASGQVTGPDRKSKDLTVTLSYGGAAAAYALAVHEHPSDHSPPSWKGKRIKFSPAGRGRKYLEKPFNLRAKGMAQRLAEKLSVDKVAMGYGSQLGNREE